MLFNGPYTKCPSTGCYMRACGTEMEPSVVRFRRYPSRGRAAGGGGERRRCEHSEAGVVRPSLTLALSHTPPPVPHAANDCSTLACFSHPASTGHPGGAGPTGGRLGCPSIKSTRSAPARPAKSVQPAREGSPRLRGPPGGPPVAVRRVVAERRRCKPPSYGEP